MILYAFGRTRTSFKRWLGIDAFTGETIKNWRPRYFYLYEDGTFLGFKQNVENPLGTEPLNNFTVRGCQIMKTDRPKAFTFIIRGLSHNRTLERSFCTENERDRQDWINAIEHVAEMLGPAQMSPAGSQSSPQSGPSAGSLAFMNSASNLASSGTVSENKMLTNTPVGSYDSLGSNSSSMMDVDLSNKFAVQGVSYGRTSGKAKVVS
jgi:hypothetical protein